MIHENITVGNSVVSLKAQEGHTLLTTNMERTNQVTSPTELRHLALALWQCAAIMEGKQVELVLIEQTTS